MVLFSIDVSNTSALCTAVYDLTSHRAGVGHSNKKQDHNRCNMYFVFQFIVLYILVIGAAVDTTGADTAGAVRVRGAAVDTTGAVRVRRAAVDTTGAVNGAAVNTTGALHGAAIDTTGAVIGAAVNTTGAVCRCGPNSSRGI